MTEARYTVVTKIEKEHLTLFAPLLVSTAWDIEERVCGDLLQHFSAQFHLESRPHKIC